MVPYPYLVREYKQKYGKTHRSHFWQRILNVVRKKFPEYYLECDACGHKGPVKHTKRGAIRAWNKEVIYAD
jgi:hypothetical protein